MKNCRFVAYAGTLLWCLLATTTTLAQTSSVLGNKSSAKTDQRPQTWSDTVCSNREFDFGRVAVGSTPVHRFRLNNHTDREIKINSVASSCGCAKAELSSKVIEAGGFVELEVSPQTSKLRGKKSASIHVRFDRPLNEIKFSVKMNISNFKLSHNSLVFTPRKKTDSVPQTQKLEIDRIDGAAWSITKVHSSSPRIEVRVDKTTGSDETSKTLIGVLEPSQQTRAGAPEQIELRTSDPLEPRIVIPVEIAAGRSPIRCSLSELSFTKEDLEQSKGKNLLVQTLEETKITVKGLDKSSFVVSSKRANDSRTHIVQVSPNALKAIELVPQGRNGQAGKKHQVGKLVVETENGDQCEVTVMLDLTESE